MVHDAVVKVATWNVNSIRARRDRLMAVLERHKPDVLCLQELKVTDEAFPMEDIRAAGYYAAVHGQRTYNGVAILSRAMPAEIEIGIGDSVEDPQARLIGATIHGARILSAYIPNGSEVGSPKYEYKLEWMRRLRARLETRYRPDAPLLLCGDFNVAPTDRDVARPEEWANTVLCHSTVREALEGIRAFGFSDVVAAQHPEGGVFTWWDYRQLAFPKNNGARIDHIFATEPMAACLVRTEVDRNERKGSSPSDHVPVIAEFDWTV